MKTKTWESEFETILTIVRNSSNTEVACQKFSRLFGRQVTWEAASRAARRLRKKGYGVPVLIDVLGENLKEQISDAEKDLDDLVYGDYAYLNVKLPTVKKSPDTYPVAIHSPITPTVTVVIPDIHFPIQDDYALAAMVAYLRDLRSKYNLHVVLLGDVLDCASLSRYDKPAEKLMDVNYLMRSEIESSKDFLCFLVELSDGNVWWLEGNHEQRRARMVDANPGLLNLPAMSARVFFEIPDGIKWVPEAYRLRIGNFYFEHGHNIVNSTGSLHVANTLMNRRPHSNLICGHFHTYDVKRKIVYSPNSFEPILYTSATIGHLSTVMEHQHYAKLGNWSHGFALVWNWESDNGDVGSHFDPIIIDGNYEFVREGTLYSGKKMQ